MNAPRRSSRGIALAAAIALACGIVGVAWSYGMGPLTCGTAPPTSGCLLLQRVAWVSLVLLAGGTLGLLAAAIVAMREPVRDRRGG